MDKNMGIFDRILRILLAIVIGYLYFSGIISGIIGFILGFLAVIFIITGIVGLCPLYIPFGIKTIKKKDNKE